MRAFLVCTVLVLGCSNASASAGEKNATIDDEKGPKKDRGGSNTAQGGSQASQGGAGGSSLFYATEGSRCSAGLCG